MKRKINLISTLVHRALVICLESTLQNELFNIRTIVMNNGFPKAVINTVITKKMNQFRRPTQLGPKKCPVHLHSPWLGNVSMKHEMQIKTAVVILQLNHALSTPPHSFCQQPKRMYYPLHIKATLFINFCATVIVGTWVVLLKAYNRGLSSTYLKPFFRDLLLKTEAYSSVLASQSKALKLKLLSPLLRNISYKTRYAHLNTMMANFPFLLVAVLLFISPPLTLSSLIALCALIRP